MRVTPTAGKLADKHGIALSVIKGTGYGGLITVGDIRDEIERRQNRAVRRAHDRERLVRASEPMTGAGGDPRTNRAAALEKAIAGKDLLRIGDYQGAVQAYTEAIALDPAMRGPYVNRAAAYRQLGLTAMAEADLRHQAGLDATSFTKRELASDR
jgi:pyruvate/2-oxoglutarate dehydrogenase complex dihydrolipoamide acyltransferase (E2) component